MRMNLTYLDFAPQRIDASLMAPIWGRMAESCIDRDAPIPLTSEM